MQFNDGRRIEITRLGEKLIEIDEEQIKNLSYPVQNWRELILSWTRQEEEKEEFYSAKNKEWVLKIYFSIRHGFQHWKTKKFGVIN